MFPGSIHKRTYIIITIVVSIPLFLWAYANATKAQTILQQKTELELIAAVTTLEQRLPQTFEQILTEESVVNGTAEQQRAVLNKHLQPIVDEVSRQYPHFGLGYYSPSLSIVAVSPFKPETLGLKAHNNSLRIYETKQKEIVCVDSGITRDGNPLIAVNYPLYSNGNMIGHVWANYKTQDFHDQFYILLSRNLGLICLLWISVLLTIGWAFRKIENSLTEFANQVKSGSPNPSKLHEFPQLIPVLDTVIQLTSDKDKVMEEMAKLDRMNLVSQMAAGVAHEIRNPLTVIKGFLQYFQMKEVAATTKEQCGIVLEELGRVEAIITDFLSLAKNRVTEQKHCNINSILEGVYPLLTAEALKNGVELTLNLDKRIPETLLNDKEIIQLILNLTRNSMEAIKEHGLVIIQTRLVDKKYIVTISDNGCGIPPEICKNIFDPFYTTKENGTGLGLAICTSIVNRHNGTIEVVSALQSGTTFTITLPIYSPDAGKGQMVM
ncbi:Adaptive-response sensory-kinase SasA [Sporomusa rhizae]|uniref:ATP-binding protein n=1 Tax=Sporomusa rhizae TaxID=357999 RepID=UPI00352BAD4C